MSQNFYTQENTIRFFHQFDTECPTDDASLKLWIQKNKEELKKLAGRNIFRIYKDDSGIQQIKFLGYIYDAESSIKVPEETWRHVEFCWFEMPLDEYQNTATENLMDEWECAVKQLYTDCTEEDALLTLVEGYTPIFINHLDDDTPEGVYIFNSFYEETDILLSDTDVFGDDSEHSYDAVCYDGYAIATSNESDAPKMLKLTYPTRLSILASQEKSGYVLKYRGLHDLTAKDIHYGDIMMAYGKIQITNKTEKQ